LFFFSEERDGLITVEVFQYKDLIRGPFIMGQSNIYLFVFKKAKIDTVYSDKIFYN